MPWKLTISKKMPQKKQSINNRFPGFSIDANGDFCGGDYLAYLDSIPLSKLEQLKKKTGEQKQAEIKQKAVWIIPTCF